MADTKIAAFSVEEPYETLLRKLGLVDAASVFDHPLIRVWRSITERENAVLDHTAKDGSVVRLHVKRDKPAGRKTPSAAEAAGLKLLGAANIPSTPLVAHGRLADGRSFVITAELSGYQDAEQWVARGLPYDTLLIPTARLAARLHDAGLHHRDLYLCHFFVASQGLNTLDVRLIDAARVRALPAWLGRRWIVKDLAQYVYSTRTLAVTDAQREAFLSEYSTARRIGVETLRERVLRKADRIARHDAALRRDQPGRAVSIGHVPHASPPTVPDHTIGES